MRRISIVPVLLIAACITASAAFAARDTAVASFESLAASGISGQATLKAMPVGGTEIHASIRGLEPGVAYVVALFPDNQTCTAGSVNQQIVQITANPAGIATVNVKVTNTLAQIGSLSIELASDLSLQACAAVVTQ